MKLVVYSKDLVRYLQHDLGIGSKSQTFNGEIPPQYIDWQYSRHIIRGLFETDGCICFSKGKGVRGYPRIELKTSSAKLVDQVVKLLEQNHFKPHVRTAHTGRTYEIYLSGKNMLDRWYEYIGFSSMKSLTKYQLWKRDGQYTPRTPLKERLKML